jgi:hypothetical protein
MSHLSDGRNAIIPRWLLIGVIISLLTLAWLALSAIAGAGGDGSRAAPDTTPPVADAGPDLNVSAPTPARLDASASHDDVGIVGWTWTVHDATGDTNLTGPLAYYPFARQGEYRVVLNVTDAAGNWATDELRVGVVTPPRPIRGLVAWDRNGYLELKWQPPMDDGGSPVLAYFVFRGFAKDALSVQYIDDGDCWVVDTQVKNGKTYYYSIQAWSLIGVGPMSEVVNSTPLSKPGAPRNFTAGFVDIAVHLNWSAPEGPEGAVAVTGYFIYRGTDRVQMDRIAEVNETTFSFTDTDITFGRTYYYSVGTDSYFGAGNISGVEEVFAIGPKEGPAEVEAGEAVVAALAVVCIVAIAVVLWRARATK